jgi:hypothetical protein
MARLANTVSSSTKQRPRRSTSHIVHSRVLTLDRYKQMTIASDAYVVLSDQRVERLQTTVTDYIDRIAFLETTIKELQLSE